jgi:hypothetical protein
LTAQELDVLVAAANVHVLGPVKVLPAAAENDPEPFENVTVPVGVVLVPVSTSVTVAVHFVAWPTTTVAGTQLTVVDVSRWVMPTDVVEVLAATSSEVTEAVLLTVPASTEAAA